MLSALNVRNTPIAVGRGKLEHKLRSISENWNTHFLFQGEYTEFLQRLTGVHLDALN